MAIAEKTIIDFQCPHCLQYGSLRMDDDRIDIIHVDADKGTACLNILCECSNVFSVDVEPTKPYKATNCGRCGTKFPDPDEAIIFMTKRRGEMHVCEHCSDIIATEEAVDKKCDRCQKRPASTEGEFVQTSWHRRTLHKTTGHLCEKCAGDVERENAPRQMLAVYGTLRNGWGNQQVMGRRGTDFIGPIKTVRFTGLEMRAQGIPFVNFVKDPASSVLVEIFDVSIEQLLGPIDSLESHPHGYERTWIDQHGGAWIYINKSGARLVPSGNFNDTRDRRW